MCKERLQLLKIDFLLVSKVGIQKVVGQEVWIDHDVVNCVSQRLQEVSILYPVTLALSLFHHQVSLLLSQVVTAQSHQ